MTIDQLAYADSMTIDSKCLALLPDIESEDGIKALGLEVEEIRFDGPGLYAVWECKRNGYRCVERTPFPNSETGAAFKALCHS